MINSDAIADSPISACGEASGTNMKKTVTIHKRALFSLTHLTFLPSGGNSVKYTEPNLFLMHMNMEIVYNTIQIQYTIQIHSNTYITEV